MTKPATFIDQETGEAPPLSARIWRAPNAHPLLISDLPGISRAEIDTSKRSIWRYAQSLPIEIADPISLGEGCTPLIALDIDGLRIHFKLEWFAPTGSFKDRGVSVLISFLKQQGITEICEDSSGNAGASVAAYGAAAGMDVTILVPAYTQPAKIIQARAYGATVELIPGTRADTARAAIEQAKTSFYASHNWHPMFLQGTKSIGYEIWEDLGFCVPDNIVIPASEGSNVMGCYLAFSELMRAGEIDQMPRLFVSQPQNCAPLHHLVHGTEQTEFHPTIAEGTAVQSPVRLQHLARLVADTRGGTIAISEEEILAATKRLARAGLLAEPSSAHAWIGAKKLVENGSIRADEQTVVILTGTGLKAQSVFAG
jgi:threonine synthase